MRPAPRLLALVLAIIALSILALTQPALPLEAVALLWVALGLLILVDLVVTPSARRVEIDLDGPGEVFTGQTAQFGAHLRGWTGDPTQLEGQVSLAGATPQDRADMTFRQGLDGLEARLEVEGRRRGTVTLQDLWLKWPSQMGLMELVPRVTLNQPLSVMPNIQPVSSGTIDVQVRSELFGIKDNLLRGEGAEFHQLREFTTGMDTRAIDWKRSARKRALVAKELRAERNHHVILAIDNGFLMREEIAGMPKIDHAVTAALAVAWAANVGGDLVGHYAYDVRPRSFAKPEAGRAAFVRLRSWAAELDYVSRETNHTLALTELNARTPKRSLIIIFTDFVDTTSAELMLENISILAKRHLILFVAIRDPELEGMIEETPQDMSGVATLVAANQSISERRLVLERLTRMGVTVIDAKPNQVTGRLISAYLDIKESELI